MQRGRRRKRKEWATHSFSRYSKTYTACSFPSLPFPLSSSSSGASEHIFTIQDNTSKMHRLKQIQYNAVYAKLFKYLKTQIKSAYRFLQSNITKKKCEFPVTRINRIKTVTSITHKTRFTNTTRNPYSWRQEAVGRVKLTNSKKQRIFKEKRRGKVHMHNKSTPHNTKWNCLNLSSYNSVAL